jgi:hypothetical protein
MPRAGRQTNGFLLSLPELIHTEGRAHPNFNSISFKVSVFRLTRIGGERH